MSSDRTEECCTSSPRIIVEGYQRQGTVKETANGLKYYESAVDVTRSDLAVVLIYDVRSPVSCLDCYRPDGWRLLFLLIAVLWTPLDGFTTRIFTVVNWIDIDLRLRRHAA